MEEMKELEELHVKLLPFELVEVKPVVDYKVPFERSPLDDQSLFLLDWYSEVF